MEYGSSGLLEGKAAVHEAWCQYYRELDAHMRNMADLEWSIRNRFFVGVKRDTHQISAEWSSSVNDQTPFPLYDSDWIPISEIVMQDACGDADQMEQKLMEIVNQVETLEAQFLQQMRPLVVTGYETEGVLRAFSLKEKKWMYVKGYKSYHDSFYVSDTPDHFHNQGFYTAHVFPRQLRMSLDLELVEELWSLPSSGDEWELRDARPCKKLQHTEYTRGYKDAIQVANIGRSIHNVIPEMFAMLERRLNRFEELDELGGPDKVLSDCMRLVNEAATEIIKAMPIC